METKKELSDILTVTKVMRATTLRLKSQNVGVLHFPNTILTDRIRYKQLDKLKGEGFNNFIKTTDYSVFRNKYVFFDAKDRVSDALFTKFGVPVRIKKEYMHPDKRYVVVLCSVKKKDSSHFEQALNDLKNKLLLLGYRDYGCFCNEIMGLLKAPYTMGVTDAGGD